MNQRTRQPRRWSPTRGVARLLVGLGVLLAGFGAATPLLADETAPVDPIAALNEGNRLFRDGRLEDAVSAYRLGYHAADPHPTLVYNLGTALHHLDRLPEAILWYRRANDKDDPWLRDNLWLARRTLGSQILPPGGLDGLLAGRTEGLKLLGILAAWLALLLAVAGERLPRWSWGAAATLAVALYGTAAAADRWSSQPAVLLEDCRTEAGELPSGTEAWVRPAADGAWRVAAAQDAVCPDDTVALVEG